MCDPKVLTSALKKKLLRSGYGNFLLFCLLFPYLKGTGFGKEHFCGETVLKFDTFGNSGTIVTIIFSHNSTQYVVVEY